MNHKDEGRPDAPCLQGAARNRRGFAHTCESGNARRTWLRGVEDVTRPRISAQVREGDGSTPRVNRAELGMTDYRNSVMTAKLAPTLPVVEDVKLSTVATGCGPSGIGGIALTSRLVIATPPGCTALKPMPCE